MLNRFLLLLWFSPGSPVKPRIAIPHSLSPLVFIPQYAKSFSSSLLVFSRVSRQTANIAAYAFPTPSPSPPWDRGQALQQHHQQQQYYHQLILQQQQQQQQQYILLQQQQQQQQGALLQQQQEFANYYQQVEQQQQLQHTPGAPPFVLPQTPSQHLQPQQHSSPAPAYGYYYYYPHQPTPSSSLTPSPASSLIPSPHDAIVTSTASATDSASSAAPELTSTSSSSTASESSSSNNNTSASNTHDSHATPTSDSSATPIASLTTPSASTASALRDSYPDQHHNQQLVYPNMAQIVNQHPQMMIVPAPAAAPGPGSKDSRWLTLEVCREFQRSKCSRSDNECKFAHPPTHVEVQNGRVVACFDSIKSCPCPADVLLHALSSLASTTSSSIMFTLSFTVAPDTVVSGKPIPGH
ncbi:hypothetical protein RRG08_024593 [Elysia crispata]|uniref:C3H1-type domain-containing protein n=1 Tax=Elysia crispata TaxID=231223 RepID=A0AAE0ZXM5_9GAST|nr:hypothetical protein RRG08_024593 [Elysia crispata]